MTINAQTKIATLIRENPETLEAIVSLSPNFTKLRNPFLRKVIGSRTSIATASKLGGCSVDDFFKTLEPMGFEIDRSSTTTTSCNEPKPGFMKNLAADKTLVLDVRTYIENGKDPLDSILLKLKALESGLVLKIINSFEPTPLIALLEKRGYLSYSENISPDLVYTYFYKGPGKQSIKKDANPQASAPTSSWSDLMDRFKGRIESLDVRNLPMPMPMHAILEALENFPTDKALLVRHKRIPVYLLPELRDRHLSYRIHEIGDLELDLLIYND